MEIRCISEEAIPASVTNDINQNRLICIQLSLTADSNEYNTLFMQNLLSEWERKTIDGKIRRIRNTEVNSKLSKNEAEKKSIIRSLLTSIENATTYVPFGWTQEHNDTTWNDTEVNMTYPNATVMPTKLYVLILLAILVILLFAITALACYYDCENRRGHLLAAKYGSIKRDTVPTVTIKSEGKQSGVIDKRKIREDVTQESSVHSRTLRKRKMLIEARRSASTKSVTCSDFGDSILFNKDIPKLSYELEKKLFGDDEVHTATPQVTQVKRSKSISDEASEVSSTETESSSEEGSKTGSEDLEQSDQGEQS